MMKQKLIIDNVVFSIQQIGGISVVWYEIIKRLLKDDCFDVEFIEFRDASNNYYRQLLNIPVEKIHVEGGSNARKVMRYVNPYIRSEKPCIFHSSYYRTARNRMIKNVTTVHDFNYEWSGDKDLRTKVHIWQQKKAVMNSDAVICISENTKRELLSFYKGYDERKVRVIYNGVSDDYSVLDSMDCIELPFEKGSYCMFVGGRPGYKNFMLAANTVAATDFNMVIVGPPLNENEKKMMDETIGKDHYVCVSKVPNQRLNELYNGANCLLYLSSYEGFGIPCIEAQKAGCPVIAYNSSSIPEVMADKNALLNSLDVKSVLDKIHRIQNEQIRKESIIKGLTFANKFSWDNTYKDLISLYSDVILKNNI